MYTEKKAFGNLRASDKCGNRETLRRSSSSVTAPKLNNGFVASRRFCFAPAISLKKNLNDCEDNRSAEFKDGLPGVNGRAAIFDRTSMLNLKLKYSKQSICVRNLTR